MSIPQRDTRRTTVPVTIDLTASEHPASERPRPAAKASGAGAATAGRDEFDVLKLPPARYDRWDRLYRNVVLVLFVIGIAVGFWFRH